MVRSKCRLLLLACAAILAPFVAAQQQHAPDPATLVQTPVGPIVGFTDQEESVRVYRGIPFAKPPVGVLRWEAPQPAAPFDQTYEATDFRSRCAQVDSGILIPASTEEDCLFLHVYTPIPPEGKKLKDLPVLFWIHGGGFSTQDASEFNATKIVNEGNLIFVSTNYRLSVFGWLSFPGLSSDGSANFGILDQQLAMKWTQQNIAAFGGDPSQITIGGESAGAGSVLSNLLSPSAKGLFKGAIGESSAPLQTATGDVNSLVQTTTKLAKALGCNDSTQVVSCLRALDSATVFNASTAFGFGPIHGDPVIPLSAVEAFTTGQFNRVPIIIGGNRDEWRLFVAIPTTAGPAANVTLQGYNQTLTNMFGSNASLVFETFPPGDTQLSINLAFSDMMSAFGTGISLCSDLFGWRAMSQWTTVYAFEHRDRSPHWGNGPSSVIPAEFTGAYHAGELDYLFNWSPNQWTLTTEQAQLGEIMKAYWIAFATTGNPSDAAGKVVAGATIPEWPKFDGGNMGQGLDIASADGVGPVDVSAEHHCDLFESFGLNT